MICITGATGGFGSAVINYLLKGGIPKQQISALTRDTEKAKGLGNNGIHVIEGNYDNYASLITAFKGVEKLLFIPGRDLDNRIRQNENVVRAAIEAGVRHVVYASFERKNETKDSPLWMIAKAHLMTEKILKESVLSYTILKNNLYMDFIPDFIGKDIRRTGTIYLPAGDGKISAALRSDMAGAAAEVLVSQGHENKVYEITNTQAYSYSDIAGYLSDIMGKVIHYVSVTPGQYAEALKQAGVPSRVSNISMGFALAQAQGELDYVSNDLAFLIKRQPVSLKAYLEYFYRKG